MENEVSTAEVNELPVRGPDVRFSYWKAEGVLIIYFFTLVDLKARHRGMFSGRADAQRKKLTPYQPDL